MERRPLRRMERMRSISVEKWGWMPELSSQRTGTERQSDIRSVLCRIRSFAAGRGIPLRYGRWVRFGRSKGGSRSIARRGNPILFAVRPGNRANP